MTVEGELRAARERLERGVREMWEKGRNLEKICEKMAVSEERARGIIEEYLGRSQDA